MAMPDDIPSPPFIEVDGIYNLRDLGGYAINSTTSIRRNFIYRSAHLSSVTATGSKALVDQLGVRRIYDFRSLGEAEKTPSVEIEGALRCHVPVFRDIDASPEGLALRYGHYTSPNGVEGFVKAYSEISQAAAKHAFKVTFEHIRDRPTEALLFHCAAGKDRTGVFAALVMRIAGVRDDDLIGYEYQLTELGARHLREEIIERLAKHPALNGNREGAERMVSARAEAMKGTLKWLDETYGSAEGYLREAMGFSDEDIEIIRKNLVVDEKAIL
ncbi:hypothetical protein FQN57_003913 [Myotisia sp. PD_48]|nr:hypothetical protein FQN57_003913 [Myotisia sp. PD_48]